MPWGWECRAKLIRQRPLKPTERKGLVSGEASMPGPQHYEPPEIFCGRGFSKIKRAPAYTFGHITPAIIQKPAAAPNARMFNVQGQTCKGKYRITHSVLTPHIETPTDKTKNPGPAAYAPQATRLRCKRPPAYTMRPRAQPPYQPWDMWTAPPNMYWPPIPGKKEPAFSFGNVPRPLTQVSIPGPGEHDPNFKYVKKTKPAFSFGSPYKPIKPPLSPPPNRYCEKKFMASKRTIPAPSFGIRHTPYLGKYDVYTKPAELDNIGRNGS